MSDASLDFLVIGVQKGGTTSLWHYLRGHPAISMPELKEEPFFCTEDGQNQGALREFVATHFGQAPRGALLGKATPHYMMGSEHADLEEIVDRIASANPQMRLIALLRDPIDRAVSQYRMSVRRRLESRSFDAAAEALLDPRELVAARTRPTEANTYVVQGEYGRILQAYRRRFPPTQLHVEMTAGLENEPDAVLDRTLDFLGLDPGYRPQGLGVHHYRGGSSRRLDPDARRSLLGFMTEHVWPATGDQAERLERLFKGFLEVWDVEPDRDPVMLSESIRARLERHYAADAEALAALGYPAPWMGRWQDSVTLARTPRGGAQGAPGRHR